MIPYTSFLYFGISLYVIIPALIAGLFKRVWRIWLVIATAVMLIIQYFTTQKILPDFPVNEILLVIAYAVYQWLLAIIFLAIRKRGKSQPIFYLAVFLSLLPLLGAKFVPLFQPGYQIFFLGLSYVSFRSLDVIIGIHDEMIQSVPPIQYLTYLLLFTTISSGPIDRFRRFNEDWKRERTRDEFLLDLDGGIHRIFTGFLYKFILAALIKQYWLDPMSQGTNILHIASYMYAYTFYLFFDFAGYSAFAIGFSYIFGIHTPENFNRPFLARDIRDFWNRWHMTLSFWFRDHIYNRFVFTALKNKWFKNRYTASYIGYIITMGLMGVWHGTTLNYIVYGLYHGILLALTDWLNRRYKGNRLLNDKGFGWQAASIFITFHLIAFSFLIFSGRLFV
ncbi:MAG: D-alanyl-lipoteichoic acid biosynthesis protein DltB [Chloroflexi bacterium]|nr:D-alanyl-lipoteichoic acid biosynthesis protein DltB [Chloroflexota bacterium]